MPRKKATITKTLLKNLGATFEGGQAVVVGANLKYQPVAIPDKHLHRLFEREAKPGWFKNGPAGLDHLPVGEQKFAGVPFQLLDFRTSPVPSPLRLSGHGSEVKVQEVKGIKVDQKADALFFLHTFNARPEYFALETPKGTTSADSVQICNSVPNGKNCGSARDLEAGDRSLDAMQPKALPKRSNRLGLSFSESPG